MKNYSYYFVVVSIMITLIMNIPKVENQRTLIPAYRILKDLFVEKIGRTMSVPIFLNRAVSDGRVQKPLPPSYKFPCSDYVNPKSTSWTRPRSKKRPKSVHALRPGDIDIVSGLGDSLTAGNGAGATHSLQMFVENRGVSWSMGGQGNWREYFTIPNMLKVFNPNLIGYSLSDAHAHHQANQFNIAEFGAMSRDLPHQAKELTKRLKNDPRVNMNLDWKLITIIIGANDFCGDACYRKNPRDIVQNHFNDLHSALSIIKNNIPRTFVNIVPAPDVFVFTRILPRPDFCEATLRITCPCIVGESNKAHRKSILKSIKKWQQIDMDIGELPEFNDKEDFTVVSQPFDTEIDFPRDKTGQYDFKYFSMDCFHLSQRGYARAANALWNNMFEPVGEKSRNWKDLYETIKCPTKENPYIYTRKNSMEKIHKSGT